MANFVYYRIEKIVGKGENAGYQHFLLFPHFFYPVIDKISPFPTMLCKGSF